MTLASSKSFRRTWLGSLAIAIFLGTGCQVSTAPPSTSTSTTVVPFVDGEVGFVISVTDGDTFRVRLADGTEEPVRLIGIDAPEDGSLMDFEATAYLERLVLGKDVRLAIDQSDRDRFGRLLRYAYVGESFVNEEMVRAGMAIARRYEPDTAMATVLEAAQSGAEQSALGIFSATTTPARETTPAFATTPAPETTSATATTPAPQTGCHPSYPDGCIPAPPPDLDCADVPFKNFTVLSPDPHRFDGNDDGVGCES